MARPRLHNPLAGTKTETRLRRYIREALERRYNRRFDDLARATRKFAETPPPWLGDALKHLDAAAAKMLTRMAKAPTKIRSALLRRLDQRAWASILETAVRERLRGNIKGAIREQMLDLAEEMGNLMDRMGAKILRANKTGLGGGSWRVPPRKVRGAISASDPERYAELGDYLVVAYAGDPLPRVGQKRKKIWIMAAIESKSPTNKWDAFAQLRNDVERIRKNGITIDGVHYRPDEIHVDLPAERIDPEDWATELVAALPRDIRSADRYGELTQGIIVNVWKMDAEEAELEWAVDRVLEVVKAGLTRGGE